jgi:hypothetical protein
MNIQPIVEGHGEVEAVPVLLRRLRDLAEAFTINVGRPIKRHRSQLIEEKPLRDSVRLALLKADCAAVIIIFDGDDDCPATLGPRVQAWAQEEAGQVPCAVVIPHREYEAWFLAARHPPYSNPESVRDAKGALDELVGGYLPTVDQPSFSATFEMSRAYAQSRSFRRMVRVFGTLAIELGADLKSWPPSAWLTEQA